jgi:hypothetical protein
MQLEARYSSLPPSFNELKASLLSRFSMRDMNCV